MIDRWVEKTDERQGKKKEGKRERGRERQKERRKTDLIYAFLLSKEITFTLFTNIFQLSCL